MPDAIAGVVAAIGRLGLSVHETSTSHQTPGKCLAVITLVLIAAMFLRYAQRRATQGSDGIASPVAWSAASFAYWAPRALRRLVQAGSRRTN